MATPGLYPMFTKAESGGAGTVNIVEAVVVTLEPDNTVELVPDLEVEIATGNDVQIETGVSVEVDTAATQVEKDE